INYWLAHAKAGYIVHWTA
nr:Chain A, DP5_conformation1 [synthetic construct]2DX4_A Chain A, DP5_conformation2 [synthetic construct]